MAAKTGIANLAAKAALDAVTALLNVGGAGHLKIYSGTAPVDSDTALVTANVVLADFTLNATAFAASTDAAPGALATANSISDVNASATGTATFARVFNNAGVCKGQFNVGTAAAAVIVSSTSFVSGQPCSVTSFTLSMPEGDTF